MATLLNMAARLDAQRAADLSANDEALAYQPRVLRAFAIQIKAGKSVRSQFECMAHSSMDAVIQHADLCAEKEYLVVRSLEVV